jgi:hypothetical protein
LTRWLKVRAGLGAAGVLLALAGFAVDARSLLWAAVAVLVPALVLRLADRSAPDGGASR